VAVFDLSTTLSAPIDLKLVSAFRGSGRETFPMLPEATRWGRMGVVIRPLYVPARGSVPSGSGC